MLDSWTITKSNGNGTKNSGAKNTHPLVTGNSDTTTVVWVGDVPIGGTDAVVMAGPCSVESREQVTATALAVKRAGAVILRGGAYKPRTSPYDFQGSGCRRLKAASRSG
jgi:3-deoxy-D-arabino-heptulosonate 7-phosphate (DAHP) synthase